MGQVSRRTVLGTTAAMAVARIAPARAVEDGVTIGWPSDVTSWDPNQRFTPDAQGLFKMVFDQPLDQDSSLKLIAHLITKWELAPDGLSLNLELRDDVKFQ